MQPSLDKFNTQSSMGQAASMAPLGFNKGLDLGKKRANEAPDMRRMTTQLDSEPLNEDMMMQIDKEENKLAEERSSGIRRTNTTSQAMSMRPKSVGSKDFLGLQGLQANKLRP